jgi:branched-chain amino acid transport system permease protein
MNFDTTRNPRKAYASMAVLAILLVIFPFFAQNFGNSWVRIADMALLYIMLALGLNIVVGFAGLLDLGYIAFYAVGAYLAGLLASPQFATLLESSSTSIRRSAIAGGHAGPRSSRTASTCRCG